MDTITIQLTNQKAYKLLEDMEELNLIHIVKQTSKISSFAWDDKNTYDQ